MGNLVAVAAAEHAGGAEPRRNREKANETVLLVKSMIAIGSC